MTNDDDMLFWTFGNWAAHQGELRLKARFVWDLGFGHWDFRANGAVMTP
jgi:hypothetical protein